MSEASDDFLFSSKLAKAGNTSTPNGSAVTELDVAEWPGTNPPHIHPRATEIGIVMKGELLVGILGSLDSGNKLYSRVVRAGETFLIPRGLMHFQFNVGKTGASMVVSFNSQNPGIVFVPLTLFGSNPPLPAHPNAGAVVLQVRAHRACKVFGDLPASTMDSDHEEAFAALLEEEAEADVQEEEHLMVLAALTGLLASNEKPRRGDVQRRQRLLQCGS
ncbi:Oxalate oxidase GF-2.8 [Triticum urartu]|uniref:Germin-like protein n=1 Tax=Triticum urartu TaxID=4572 RepID=M7ZGP7_TRIUA|nr:Oxalate oxidase GF-2.8 [Triticum urartu]